MQPRSSQRRHLLAALAAAALLPLSAGAQDFPTKPIRIVTPFPPGASTDLLARTVANGMSKSLGQQVIVEAKAGAGGSIAAQEVKRSPPDGYNLLLASQGILTMNQSVYKKLAYDPIKDFAPLTIGARLSILIVTHPSRPYRTVQELIAYAKANPGKVTYGSAGVGTSQHMAGELFKRMAGVDLLHVPYKGGAPAMTDLIGGQVDLMFVQTPSALPQIAGGKVRAIAVGSTRRVSQLPDLPTIAESGVPGYDSDTWYGFAAPAGTPPAVLAKLHAAMSAALRESTAQLQRDGYEVDGCTPQVMAEIIKADAAKWAEVVRSAKISLD